MKKYLLLPLLFFCLNQTQALPSNALKVSLFNGTILTPNQDVDFGFNKSHQQGGLGFGLGITHYFDSYQLHLDRHFQLGISGDYNKFADSTYNTFNSEYSRYSAYAISALMLLQYQNDNGFIAYGGAGVAKVVQDYHSSSTVQTNNHFAPEINGGVGYAFSKHINMSVFYTYITGKAPDIGSNSSVAPLNAYGANIVWII